MGQEGLASEETSVERPLGPARRVGLSATLPLLLILVPLVVGVVLVMALAASALWLVAAALAARVSFPLGERCLAALSCNVGLCHLAMVALWVGKRPATGLRLDPVVAPGFFEILRDVASRLQTAQPDEVRTEFGCNAYVELRGWRKGGSNYTLVVGWDCFSLLNEEEMTCLVAHELAHAMYMYRGFARTASRGVMLLQWLASDLRDYVQDVEQRRRFWVGRCAVWLTHLVGPPVVRMWAAWSRQSEFDAVDMEVRVCGPDVSARVTLKLMLGACLGEALPMEDRLRLAAAGPGFLTRWSDELWPADLDPVAAARVIFEREETSPYATHPLARDRLAASAMEVPVNLEKQDCYRVFASAEATARALLEVAQGELAARESDSLERVRQRIRRAATDLYHSVSSLHFVLPGVLVAVGVVWFVSVPLGSLRDHQIAITILLLGILGIWSGSRRAKSRRVYDCDLLSPPYHDALSDWLREQASGHKVIEEDRACEDAVEHLRRCRFAQALEAAKERLERDPGDLQARLVVVVASSGVGDEESSYKLACELVRERGNTYAVTLAIAWSALILERHALAFVMAEDLCGRFGPEAAILFFSAVAQEELGVRYTVLSTHRQITQIAPELQRAKYHLARQLTSMGLLREALEAIDPLLEAPPVLQPPWRGSVYALAVYCYLEIGMRRQAREVTDAVLRGDTTSATAGQLGDAYVRARMYEDGFELVQRAYDCNQGAVEALQLGLVGRHLGRDEAWITDVATRALRMIIAEPRHYHQASNLLALAASLIAWPRRVVRIFGLDGYELSLCLQGSVVPNFAWAHMYLATTDEEEAETMARRVAAAFGIPADRIGDQIERLRCTGPIMRLMEPAVLAVSLLTGGAPLPP